MRNESGRDEGEPSVRVPLTPEERGVALAARWRLNDKDELREHLAGEVAAAIRDALVDARAETAEVRAAAQRYIWAEYMPWEASRGEKECEHRRSIDIDCMQCDRALLLEGKRRQVGAPESLGLYEALRALLREDTGTDADDGWATPTEHRARLALAKAEGRSAPSGALKDSP